MSYIKIIISCGNLPERIIKSTIKWKILIFGRVYFFRTFEKTMTMKPFFHKILALGILFCLPLQHAIAAPAPPGGGSPPCWPPPCIPIDKGSVFLIAAGVALGLWKLYTSYFRKKTA